MPHTPPTPIPPTVPNTSAESSVYFDGQFWVLVLTITSGGRVYAARQILGALPSDAELYAWLLAHGGQLIDAALAGPGVQSTSRGGPQRVNPKRAARQAAKQAAQHAPSTASQEALARAREQQAATRAQASTAERRRREQERYEQRRIRAKRRHRGH